MKARRFALLALALAAFALPSFAGGTVGSQFPATELEDFANTKAKSFDDFGGRAILLEFFAFW